MPDATPILALPYPLGDDAIRDYPAIAQELAEDAEAAILAAGNVTRIAEVLVGAGGAADVDFTGIPATFRHLRVYSYVRTNAAGSYVYCQCNGDTVAGYEGGELSVRTSTITTGINGAQPGVYSGFVAPSSEGANVFAANVQDWIDYANTTNHKTANALCSCQGPAVNAWLGIQSGRWPNIAAINRLRFYPSAGSFIQGSRITLYGIK